MPYFALTYLPALHLHSAHDSLCHCTHCNTHSLTWWQQLHVLGIAHAAWCTCDCVAHLALASQASKSCRGCAAVAVKVDAVRALKGADLTSLLGQADDMALQVNLAFDVAQLHV